MMSTDIEVAILYVSKKGNRRKLYFATFLDIFWSYLRMKRPDINQNEGSTFYPVIKEFQGHLLTVHGSVVSNFVQSKKVYTTWETLKFTEYASCGIQTSGSVSDVGGWIRVNMIPRGEMSTVITRFKHTVQCTSWSPSKLNKLETFEMYCSWRNLSSNSFQKYTLYSKGKLTISVFVPDTF